MKRLHNNKYFTPLLIQFLFCLLFLAACRKHHTDNNGLPPATQEGKNTLGFLLNGQPWTPQGFNGTANLSIDVDYGYNNGIFNIAAYRILGNNSDSKQTIGFGLSDSLNLINVPQDFLLGKSTLFGLAFIKRDGCTYDYFDTTIKKTGNLTITKLDKLNHIISGTFTAKLSASGCDTIQITDGRFDMKY